MVFGWDLLVDFGAKQHEQTFATAPLPYYAKLARVSSCIIHETPIRRILYRYCVRSRGSRTIAFAWGYLKKRNK